MKLDMELAGTGVQELKFFADAVIWSGSKTDEDIQGRMMLSDMVPDPGERCPELKRLTVLDECARALNARLECCAGGSMRVVGRLEIPLEAEFADDCGNTYFCKCTAGYNVTIDAEELTHASCGEIVLQCAARELTVQAVSRECVAYQLKLDVYAYLTRKTLIRIEYDDIAGAGAPVIVREGCVNMPSGAAVASGNSGVPVMGDVARRMNMSGSGYSMDSLAAGAARNCCGRPGTKPQKPPKPPETPCEAADGDSDDDCRTLVKMPIHHRRR